MQNDGARLRTNFACFKLKVMKITDEDTSETGISFYYIDGLGLKPSNSEFFFLNAKKHVVMY